MLPLTTDAVTRGRRATPSRAGACGLLGSLVGMAGGGIPAPVALIGLWAGILGAAFLLSWVADAAEIDLSGGLVTAGVALLTVLPQLALEVNFAFTQQTGLVTSTLTGATRLLLAAATAIPILGAWRFARRGQHRGSVTLPPARRPDLAILCFAAAYGAVVTVLGRVSLIDAFLLLALYVLFLRRIRGTPGEPPAVVGVSARLAALPRRQRRAWLAGMTTLAAAVLLVTAHPFAVALEDAGTAIGIDRHLLVQSIVPAATQTPACVIAAMLALNRRPGQGLAVVLAAVVRRVRRRSPAHAARVAGRGRMARERRGAAARARPR